MFLLLALLSLLACFTFVVLYMVNTYRPSQMVISAPFQLGTYTFDRATLSDREQEIAWKLYVQLETRKAAQPIDENNDIVTEVYDSWYQLFTSTRQYLIDMPPSELEGNDNAQEIVKLSLDVLNKGLRPHLTKWQGKYRRWYEQALKDPANQNKTPQEIQREYPEYDRMMADIKECNVELRDYADQLKRFSHEKQPTPSTRFVAWIKDRWKDLNP